MQAATRNDGQPASAPAGDSLLSVRGLSVDFRTPRGRVHALREVGFEVPRGRTLGVVGESGSGKSTVIWSLMGLLAGNAVVTGGAALFDGRDLLHAGERELRAFRGEQATVVFQDPMTSQIPVHTYARQMLDITWRRPGSRQQKIAAAIALLRRVGIPDPERRIIQYPHQFSGGMRQRAGIAMALSTSPPLLFADEPTTALDVTMEAQIIHLLRELQQAFAATLVVVSHNLGLVAELCDEVVVMYAGEVVERGPVHTLFHAPAHPYTRALLDCDPARVIERRRLLPTIPGDLPDLGRLPAGCIFAARCPQVFERCHLEPPPLHARPAGGHAARCHLVEVASGDDLPAVTALAAAPAPPPPQAIADDPSGTPLLAIRDLVVRFGRATPVRALLGAGGGMFVDAVLGVSLTLRRGYTLGLVGESGSGKTTLGRSILGLVPVHAGSVRFEGREMVGLAARDFTPLRRDMAMMFQDPVGSLSPRHDVRSLLLEPLLIHGEKARATTATAEHLCRMVNLPPEFLARYPHELSGGQARRVGVARALALEPKLVIADEPSAGLDVSVQGEVLNLMRELQTRLGLAYLVITHNLPVVRHIADTLAIMYLGRIVEHGDCERIFARPAHPYTEALVKGVPRPDPDLRRQLVSIEGEVPSLANRPAGCEFHTRCPHAEALCREHAPAVTTLADGRTVRCHFPRTD